MAKKKPRKTSAEGPTFEQSLDRLEQIVGLLEDGQLGLDEALAQYEEGVGLLRKSYDLLKNAERRIELLSGVDPQGNPLSEPFDDRATQSADQRASRRSARKPDDDTHMDNSGGFF